jgi:hypothetical protein
MKELSQLYTATGKFEEAAEVDARLNALQSALAASKSPA